jgi:Zn-dependent protease
MKWSLKIIRIAGIDVYVHVTFFILILWIGLAYWGESGTLVAVANGVGFILALFGCVVLHELGHALTARRYGINTRNIILLPIGGVALLEKMPDDPKQEIVVALAGPAVNVMIAFILWLWLSANNELTAPDQFSVTGAPFLARLLVINMFLAIFNLLPAFPMDGGRVLRAALAMRMSYSRATQLAATIGQGLALWMGLVGLFYNPFLIIIALFVWFAAAAEAAAANVKYALSGVVVGNAMKTEFHSLSPDDPLSRVVDFTLAGNQKDFPVVVDGSLIGVLTQSDFLKGLQEEYGKQTRVDSVMNKGAQTADINEPLQQVLERLQTSDCRMIAITDSGKLVGIIDIDNILELIKIQSALHIH